MKTFAVSVFDKKVGTYSNPFYVPHIAIAVRSVSDAMAAKDSALSKYPGDFALYKLAEFDDSNGDFLTIRPPELIAELGGLMKEQAK